MEVNPNSVFVVSDADINAAAVKFHVDLVDRGVVVMIGEEHLGLDDLGNLDHLVYSHRVGLVAGQEGHVDILDVCHLGDVLGVASNVDAEAVEGEDIAVVTTLRVILLMSGCGVIGWHRLDGDVLCIFAFFTVRHHQSVAEVSVDGLIYVDARGRCANLMDGSTVEMILVLVGDEDDVSLGEGGIVGLGLEPHAHGVYLDLYTVVVDLHTGVLDARDGHFLAALGGELVYFLCGAYSQRHHSDGNQATKQSFHFYINGNVTMNRAPLM